jgi:glycosyltransferase involved in cell wall biosynthesis
MTIGRLNIGGAERRLLQLMRYLDRSGASVEVTFFVISGAVGSLDPQIRAAGARIVYGRPSVLGLIDFSRLARRLVPDLIHVNAGSAGGFYCLAGRIGGVKRTISHIRSCGPVARPFFSRHALFYEPCTSVFSSVVLGVSAATAENRNFLSSNWRVIYDGIDSAEFESAESSLAPEGFSAKGPNFVILGRLDRLKNIPHAIRSFSRFVAQGCYPYARLHVVGPEGNQSLLELRDIARAEGVADKVLLPGPTDEPLRYFRHADCALLCSDYEGLPGSALEALACGTPVVASNISPAREVASLTSGISVVSVADLPGWVSAMSAALEAERHIISSDFWNRSPFPLSRHAEAMIALWSELTGKERRV